MRHGSAGWLAAATTNGKVGARRACEHRSVLHSINGVPHLVVGDGRAQVLDWCDPCEGNCRRSGLASQNHNNGWHVEGDSPRKIARCGGGPNNIDGANLNIGHVSAKREVSNGEASATQAREQGRTRHSVDRVADLVIQNRSSEIEQGWLPGENNRGRRNSGNCQGRNWRWNAQGCSLNDVADERLAHTIDRANINLRDHGSGRQGSAGRGASAATDQEICGLP
mmetsp:Transcript_14544/g.33937  ORF Transcript_14544/g.33937 Transcript_14544/m.33937 type:complete len:224 (+) Transcript_14544:17530-18201(+)